LLPVSAPESLKAICPVIRQNSDLPSNQADEGAFDVA
jgi:hypothetical protein